MYLNFPPSADSLSPSLLPRSDIPSMQRAPIPPRALILSLKQISEESRKEIFV